MKSKRPRKRRAKNRRRKAKESTRKSKKVVTVQVTPAAAAVVVVTMTLIQKATASSRAKRERQKRRKIPVGITGPTVSSKSRVKETPLAGAGRRALTPDGSDATKSPEITDRQGQRGDGAGVTTTARRARSSWTEVKREGDTTAGTGRDMAARTGVGAAREAGRTEVKTGVTAETGRGAEVAQMEGRADQQIGGAEAGKGGRTERAEVGVEREERKAQTELKESTDCFILPF